MAKRSATELFEHYNTVLVFSLPIKDVDFMDELLKHGLLPGDLKIKLESLTIHNERSSYFLDNVIKPGLAVGNNRCFVSLLTVMKRNKHDNVKDLAKKMENELAIDLKCKISDFILLLYFNFYIFKPGVYSLRPRVPGFLVCTSVCVCVCVCVLAPKGINNQWRDMV